MELLNFPFTALVGGPKTSDGLVNLGAYDEVKHNANPLVWNEFWTERSRIHCSLSKVVRNH